MNTTTGRKHSGYMVDSEYANYYCLQLLQRLCRMLRHTFAVPC